MGFVRLKRISNESARARKRRPHARSACVQSCTVKISVDAIFSKILVDPGIPLQTISKARCVENAVIDHPGIAGQICRGCGSASRGKNVRGSLGHAGYRSPGRSVFREQVCTDSIGEILLRELGERGILERLRRTARRSRRTQWLDCKEKEELMMGNHRPTDRTGEIVAMKRLITVKKFRSGPKPLIGIVVAHVPVELIRPILAGHDCLHGACSTVLD